ncbi:NAD-specific glutamate dehydrogenase [bioreactor metagenome]|uniref:NAD-specific glutamate dehydrogenase n=1 Tax=bioreactor metagenome TaxID=1076179 RepID=A0A644YTW2_9ZZZZ
MIAAYLKQTTPYSRENIQAALVGQPEIAANLVAIFRARFRPGISSDARTTAQQEASDAVTVGLTRVPSLDHDRIIRRYREVIGAGLRTSFYQGNPDGTEPPPVIALKLNPQQLTYLPAPRPKFEIWVYGPTVEGVHLRFGRVARGGLRWSNRREDFRTEVLGLVKAQIVKNAVIVPTGAKGCFYPKHLPNPQTHRAAWLTAGRQAYKDFVTALLSVTDNLVGKELIPPAEVVRYDDDDSYLVVAADKGTATFSDVANRVALDKAFWLGDAFASGGSTGYNHKAMGITARGAWRSVIRHFSEIGVNPQTDDITVVGIGDMSGDVFGNGMLRSRHVRLIGAFDHRHIFIDPNPEAETSVDERQRLFNLPSSSWGDYSAELISDGGGVFARSAKSIPISPQMRGVLPILGEAEQATPAEVIQALLQAPVDLVWHGGIGTYVKASQEQNADIGDPANDAVRIDGSQLNCTVVGEGGNLGFSQLGRIEAAQHGIRINTDAIDNSAGVNTSDYEVNIKILLNRVVDEGDLTQRQRNDLLKSMTDEVAARVLRTNYNQNVLLGNARYLGEAMVGPQERLMQWFEERGQLDRDLEALPSSEELQRRARDGRGLTSPEFAVLVAYAKLSLTDDLLHGKLLDDPWFGRVLFDYFPHALDDLADAIAAHPLRREIIATQLANTIVNHGGITFVHRAIEETGTDPQQIARAFIILSEVFEMSEYLSAVEALDGIVPTAVQSELYLEFRRQLDRGVRHLLSRPAGLRTIDEEIQHSRRPVHDLRAELDTLLAAAGLERLRTRITELEVQGVPRDLARRVATLLYNVDAIEIVDRATQEDRAALDVAEIYFRMAEVIYLDTAQAMLPELPREGRWDAAARSSLRQELYRLTGALTAQVLETGGDDPAAQVNAWTQSHSPQLTGLASLVQQLSVEEAELGLGQVWALIRDTQRLVKVH